MTQFEQFIDSLADANAKDCAFVALVDECERSIGRGGAREDSFETRVLRVANMIEDAHFHGTPRYVAYDPAQHHDLSEDYHADRFFAAEDLYR